MAQELKSRSQRGTYLMCVLLGACGALISLLAVLFLLFQYVDFSFIENANCGIKGDFHYCFFDKDWDSASYLGVISSFYGIIITLVVSLLAVVAAFAFLVIRTSARHHAQEAMEDEVKSYFSSGAATPAIIKQLDEITEKKLAGFERRVETIVAVMEENGFEFPGRIEVDDETAA